MMDLWNLILFCVAAIILLGSPGPAIAALVAVGRNQGFKGGLPFYLGLQAGLAFAAGISAAGMFTVIQSVPWATMGMAITASAYLVYLAFRIATAPVGHGIDQDKTGYSANAFGGMLLGATNPKAYVAFASIMASYLIVPDSLNFDVLLKWAICVAVMVVVDAVWLWLGEVARNAELGLMAERAINLTMALLIVITAFLALV